MKAMYLVMVGAAALVGCTPGPEPPIATVSKTPYAKIEGHDSAARKAIGMCELVKGWPLGGGVYKVGEMYSVMEPATDATDTNGGQPVPLAPFTYVPLQSVTAWSANAPQNPVARIPGGKYPNGNVMGWMVGLAQGEEVVALFYPPYPQPTSNKGFLFLHPQGLFQLAKSGGYTNGDLYSKTAKPLAEIGQQLSQLYAAAPKCPFDVAPDVGP